MKNLIEYIIEAQVGNLDLTLDDLSNYIDEQILCDGRPKSNEFKNKIFSKFIDKYGESQGNKVFMSFDRYVESFINTIINYSIEIDDNIIHMLFDKLTTTNTKKLEKIMGVGMEASTIDLGNDRVMKLYFNNKVPFDRIKFFEICKSGKCKYFPKVYRIGKGYIVMEKLDVHSKKCEEFIRTLDSNRFGDSLYHLIQDNIVHKIKGRFSKIEQEVIEFMEGIRPYLDEVGFDSNYYGDLGFDNIGERKDGTIVFFDI